MNHKIITMFEFLNSRTTTSNVTVSLLLAIYIITWNLRQLLASNLLSPSCFQLHAPDLLILFILGTCPYFLPFSLIPKLDIIISFWVLSSLIRVQICWKYVCRMIFSETNKILIYKTPKLRIQVLTTGWQTKFGPLISSACHPLCGYVIFHDRMEFAEAIVTAGELSPDFLWVCSWTLK